MAVTIGKNIASEQVQRLLARNTSELSAVSERLSSGFRINRAKDDAAGLSIASALNADARVYTQAVRNVSDAVSLLNQADGAIAQLSTIVIRIRELAAQSANGTYSSKQREALDQEAQALSAEYSRLVGSTAFNELTLLDGSMEDLVIQAGYGTDGSLTM